ncbi:putative sporulation protein YtaF [Proteiniborus ethanoligenes]|uniref:Putative sporulation protein YtaF n=1 Tax=Proteiniborus ethanoligenes TaxID=415015 RepID=A0A1H3QB87_9FIRM|nr:sporulation membrane protein YtaF [Proteiniborus ethanoligenes]TAH63632.1 MAG: sporulation membrane protein YtaF [Gottschalkiaceae bacterium]SDZ10543.1 putative sporulation protein YtaF [Proteiniborus ethanoligenes]
MLETLLLVFVLSLDAFVASVAYGTNRIKIPFLSISIISTICSGLLAVSLFLGSIVRNIIPGKIAISISFVILLLLGVYYLFEGLIKTYLKKNPSSNKRIKLRLLNLHLILDIYLDETKADFDDSKNLNSKEALYLAVALSIDSLAVGFANSLGDIDYIFTILLSFLAGIISVVSGLFIGRRLVNTIKVDLSWLSGVILIALAILKLV